MNTRKTLVLFLISFFLVGMWVLLHYSPYPQTEAQKVASKEAKTSKYQTILQDWTGALTCPEEASRAVLDQLWPVLNLDSSETQDEAVLKSKQHTIDCLRPWSLKQEPCIRAAYDKWLDSYEREYARAQQEIREKGKAESNDEKYRRERVEEARRLLAYKTAHPLPKLPQCSPAVVYNDTQSLHFKFGRKFKIREQGIVQWSDDGSDCSNIIGNDNTVVCPPKDSGYPPKEEKYTHNGPATTTGPNSPIIPGNEGKIVIK